MSKTLKSWEDLKLLPESIDWNLDFSIETMPTRYRLSNIYHSYLYQHIFLKTYFKDSKTKAFLEQIEKEVHLHLCFNEEVSKEQLQQSVSREIADYQALWYWNKIELISKVDKEYKMNIESKFFLRKGDFIYLEGSFCFYHVVINIWDIQYQEKYFKRSSKIGFDKDPNTFSSFDAILFFNDLHYKLMNSKNEKYQALYEAIDWAAPYYIDMDSYSWGFMGGLDGYGITKYISGHCYDDSYKYSILLDDGGLAYLSPSKYLCDSNGRSTEDSEDYEENEDCEDCEGCEDCEDYKRNLKGKQIVADEENDYLFIDYGQERAILESAVKDFNRIKSMLPELGLNMQLEDL
jgi:hypothetical protein